VQRQRRLQELLEGGGEGAGAGADPDYVCEGFTALGRAASCARGVSILELVHFD
jgi:hypothetical protein